MHQHYIHRGADQDFRQGGEFNVVWNPKFWYNIPQLIHVWLPRGLNPPIYQLSMTPLMKIWLTGLTFFQGVSSQISKVFETKLPIFKDIFKWNTITFILKIEAFSFIIISYILLRDYERWSGHFIFKGLLKALLFLFKDVF